MESILDELEIVRSFPMVLLEHLRKDPQIGMAAEACNHGQIRLNINNGKVESVEWRQWARDKKG